MNGEGKNPMLGSYSGREAFILLSKAKVGTSSKKLDIV